MARLERARRAWLCCSVFVLAVPGPGLAAEAQPPTDFSASFRPALPEEAGLDSQRLAALTEWVRDNPLPIFSLLISRNGKLVYELYTAGLGRDQAHYLMSVTKTFVSAIVGAAIDRKLIAGPDAPVTATLPRRLFASDADFDRFKSITVKDVLGMSALDAPDPPRTYTPEARERLRHFQIAPNRVAFALTQKLLPAPGSSFQYNDVGPALATGLIQYASGQTALDFANTALFGALGFRNQEWMHQDATGLDNGGYGLRVRPIDMQKLGLLFLNHGSWEGRQLLSQDWVSRSWTAWNKSKPELAAPNYGWFWWSRNAGAWAEHAAHGWKGQRIAVIPAQGLVVTMTGCFEDNREEELFDRLVDQFVRPAVVTDGRALPPAPEAQARLSALLRQVNETQHRVGDWIEPRMVPSIAPKGTHHPFDPQR